MNKIKLLLTFAVLCTATYGQNTFAPVGAKWYYGVQLSFFLSDESYRTIESIKDTTIANKQCSVLKITDYYMYETTRYEYLYSEQNKVYRWLQGEEFTLLYNFSANIGDTWDVWEYYDCYSTMRVDFVDTVTISDIPLRRLHLSLVYDGCSISSFGTTITEKIGGDRYLFLFDYGGGDMFIPHFRCYDDDDISLHLMKCDYFTSINQTNNEQSNLIVSSDYVQLPITAVKADFYNTSGQLVVSAKPDNEGKVSIFEIPKGIYFVKANTADFNFQTFKFIKL